MRHCPKRKQDQRNEWFSAATSLPPDWDAGLPPTHFLQRQSLSGHEATGLPDVQHHYALLRQRGTIVAQAAFQVISVRDKHLQQSSMPGWQYTAWKLFTKVAHPKLLVGGHLFRHDVVSMHWQEELSSFEAFEWYREVLESAAKKWGAQAVLVKELPQALSPYFMHNAGGYLLLRNDISMQLRIPESWQTIADYERSLKHKYAQRFRKLRQGWEGLQVKELDETETATLSAKIYALYQQVTEHQPVRLGLLSEAFIPALKKMYPDNLKVWAVYEGENMIAFASGWVWDGHFDMFYIGFDYARNTALNLYFNILFFAIEQAILLRKPLLILGRTALEAKARVGCKPEYLNTFLYIRNGPLRNIVARLQERFSEGGSEWEQRHPFKQKD